MGEGWSAPRRCTEAVGRGAGRARPRPGDFRREEGLALINGTDGMLGMLVLALTDAGHLFRAGRHHGGAVRRGDARLRPASSPTICSGSARTPGRRCPRRTSPACWRDRRSSRATGTTDCTPVQDAYSMRCAPQVAGAARDTARLRARGRRARIGMRRGQSRRLARRAGRVDRQLPRRAAGLRARFPGHRGGRGGAHQPNAGSTGCSTSPAPRPATPFLSPTIRASTLGPHDRAVHGGRDRRRTNGWPRPRASTRCRQSAMQEDHVSMGWAAARKLRRGIDSLTSCSRSRCSTPPAASSCASR